MHFRPMCHRKFLQSSPLTPNPMYCWLMDHQWTPMYFLSLH